MSSHREPLIVNPNAVSRTIGEKESSGAQAAPE